MITVNLYADRMMATEPTSADEVLYATRSHSELYADAAHDLGLSPKQYGEFRSRLMDGKVVYVRLPHHLDGMAGQHHGHAYALKNVNVTQASMGWKVALTDGTTIYVPQICGNLSVLRGKPVHIAHVRRPAPHVVAVHRAAPPQRLVAASHEAPPAVPTQVTLEAPPAAPVAAPAEIVAAAPVAPLTAVTAPVSRRAPFFVAPLIGFLFGVGGGGGSNTPNAPPPCSAGSNLLGVCQAGH